MKRILLIIIVLCVSLVMHSCADGNKHQGMLDPNSTNVVVVNGQTSKSEGENLSMTWNEENVQREQDDIYFFMQRYHWKAQPLGSGVYVEILEEGSGPLVNSGDEVSLEYVTQALTGDTVYTSQQSGLKTFMVDKSEEISGLHEAVKMMRKGSRAHIVIPSWRAYGVGGDGNHIRGKMSLAMTVKVTDIQVDKAN